MVGILINFRIWESNRGFQELIMISSQVPKKKPVERGFKKMHGHYPTAVSDEKVCDENKKQCEDEVKTAEKKERAKKECCWRMMCQQMCY